MTAPNPDPSAQEVAAINTNVRLFDLVRYSRAELHHDGLITDEEYGWLCAMALMSKSPKGGSPSPRRLEDYDELRTKLNALQQRCDALEKALDRIGFFFAGDEKNHHVSELIHAVLLGKTIDEAIRDRAVLNEPKP